VVEAVVVGVLAWQQKIPTPYLAPGHAALMALPTSLRLPLLRVLPIEAADLLPYLAGLIALAFLVKVARSSRSRVRARNLGEMLALTPYQFEECVAGLLRAQGYKGVRRVGGSGDPNPRHQAHRGRNISCVRFTVSPRQTMRAGGLRQATRSWPARTGYCSRRSLATTSPSHHSVPGARHKQGGRCDHE